MADLLLVAIAAATASNFVLVRLLGLCPVLGGRTAPRDLARTTATTTVALMATAGLGYLLENLVLAPLGLPYLRLIGFLAIALLAVRAAHRLLGGPASELPALTLNCLVLGVALLAAGTTNGLSAALALGLGAGLGFGLVLTLFTGLLPRLESAPVPANLRGPALALVTLGIMSLAFLGFTGMGSQGSVLPLP